MLPEIYNASQKIVCVHIFAQITLQIDRHSFQYRHRIVTKLRPKVGPPAKLTGNLPQVFLKFQILFLIKILFTNNFIHFGSGKSLLRVEIISLKYTFFYHVTQDLISIKSNISYKWELGQTAPIAWEPLRKGSKRWEMTNKPLSPHVNWTISQR